MNKICVKCGKLATIYGSEYPTSCDDCYEKIKAWRAVNFQLPYKFMTTLQNWEHESPLDALKEKYERRSITEVEFRVMDYSILHEAFELALQKKSKIVKFNNLIFSTKETEEFIADLEMSL